MGRCRVSRRKTSKTKSYKRALDTKRRPRDIDQIQDDIKKGTEEGKPKSFEIDDDLPGLGQFYCIPCARHFADAPTLAAHVTTKIHRRRLKDIAQPQYLQSDAEWAAGKVKEILPPAHG